MLSMEAYEDSVKDDPFTLVETKLYRKYIGRFGWLVEMSS